MESKESIAQFQIIPIDVSTNPVECAQKNAQDYFPVSIDLDQGDWTVQKAADWCRAYKIELKKICGMQLDQIFIFGTKVNPVDLKFLANEVGTQVFDRTYSQNPHAPGDLLPILRAARAPLLPVLQILEPPPDTDISEYYEPIPGGPTVEELNQLLAEDSERYKQELAKNRETYKERGLK